jgi:hypothetical protein
MSESALKKQIRTLEAQLKQACAHLVALKQANAEAACARREQVVAYEMRTGIRYVCGQVAFMVSDRNSRGEHKITQVSEWS